ncbi:MAG TPA: ATP-binding protein [Burkholderiales bacterium]
MRLVRAFVYGSVALILGMGWAFLYWQSGAIDLAAGNAARSALVQLRGIDERWNAQLAAARFASGRLEPAPFDAAYAWLELQALRLPHAELGRALGAVRSAFESKASLLRRIGADDPLEDLSGLVAVAPRLDRLSLVLEHAFDDALARAERYRAWLLYYSAGVLVLVALLAFALRRANVGLEERVRERTRELERAMEELKQSQAMLVQSEKMSSLGQMVAGLAHEVNTPLAYVKASLEAVRTRAGEAGRLARETQWLLELLQAEKTDEAALAAQFATVRALLQDKRFESLEAQLADGLHGIEQLGELVASLKDFSRLERGSVAQVDLHQGIEATLRIAQPQLGKRVVRKTFGQIPPVSCAPSQINQVLLNLIVNAAQATREADGAIELRTSMRDPDHVAIDVIDNGPGIAKDVLPKIFDPFFTTKAVGKGTGLGLSISYRIVQRHGGKLEVESRPGAGTRFTVLLPVNAPQALAA